MITFDNVNLEDAFGCKIYRLQTGTAPARQFEAIEILGRSGDLLMDNKRYPNVETVYTIFFYEEHNSKTAWQNAIDLKSYIVSKKGYCRLEDDEYPDEYFMAVVGDVIEPVATLDMTMVRMEVYFNRKPQRYLKSGETAVTFTSSSSITNPTDHDSQPLLRVYGSGVLGWGSQSITITNTPTYLDIDCAMMDCYLGTANKNSNVVFSDYNFPVLKPGTNNFSFGTGITKLIITPRWYKL